MNRDKIFTAIRTVLPTFTQIQVDSINAILDSCEKHLISDPRFISYILATTYHETAHTWLPIEEYGKGKGYPYGKKLDIGKGPNKRIAYQTPDKLFYGRGFVQLTWLSNYMAFARLLKVDLVNRPELALQPDIAAEVLVIGMRDGMFTGHRLIDSFNKSESDPVEARYIVNGQDKATLIAGYYYKFIKGF